MALPDQTGGRVPLLHPASPFSRWLQGPEFDCFLPALGRLMIAAAKKAHNAKFAETGEPQGFTSAD